MKGGIERNGIVKKFDVSNKSSSRTPAAEDSSALKSEQTTCDVPEGRVTDNTSDESDGGYPEWLLNGDRIPTNTKNPSADDGEN